MLGEATRGKPSNLMPLLCKIAGGELAELAIYGGDWPTPDGTGIRDYLHVQDLAEGHVAALRYLGRAQGAVTLNLGAGRGYSVLEVAKAFEAACGRKVTRTIAPRRPGDVASYYADPSRAERLLQWKATRGLDTICADAWRWQRMVGAIDAHRDQTRGQISNFAVPSRHGIAGGRTSDLTPCASPTSARTSSKLR